MGRMLIRDEEGAIIGVFRLEGDVPNEQENQALIEFMGDPESEEDLLPPSVTRSSNVRELVSGAGGRGRIRSLPKPRAETE